MTDHANQGFHQSKKAGSQEKWSGSPSGSEADLVIRTGLFALAQTSGPAIREGKVLVSGANSRGFERA